MANRSLSNAAKHIKKGAMTAAAKREGVSNARYEQEHKGENSLAGKRARLALAFKHARKK